MSGGKDWTQMTAAELHAEATAHVALIRRGPQPPQTLTYAPTSVYSPKFGELVGTEVWNGKEMARLPLGTLLVDEYGTSYRVAETLGNPEVHVTLKESRNSVRHDLHEHVSYSNPRVVVWHP